VDLLVIQIYLSQPVPIRQYVKRHRIVRLGVPVVQDTNVVHQKEENAVITLRILFKFSKKMVSCQ